MSDIRERILFKEKRIEEYKNISDYKRCDELKEDIMTLRKQLRELEAEKKKLSIATRKSEWYHKKSSSPKIDDPERQNVESVNLESQDQESQDHKG